MGGGAEAGVRLGLGKQEEDHFYTASDNIQRKKLEVEIQAEEDNDRTAKREVGSFNFKTSSQLYCNVCVHFTEHTKYIGTLHLGVVVEG